MAAPGWTVLAWSVLAWAVLGLRVIGVLAVAARRVPAWSGPVVEVLLWVGGPAVLDPAALCNTEFWAGLVLLLILWCPPILFARRPPGRSSGDVVVLVVTAALVLGVQVAITQFVVAGTVSEATAGRVCLPPRKPSGLAGDLFPLLRGSRWTCACKDAPEAATSETDPFGSVSRGPGKVVVTAAVGAAGSGHAVLTDPLVA